MLQEPDIHPYDLENINIPALIVAGEKDCVKEKETETIAKSIPNAELKILSGENHTSYIVQKDTLYPYIKGFIR